MKHDRLSQLVRRWVYRVRRPGRRDAAATARNFVRLAVTECESRIAPAQLPAPIVAEYRSIVGTSATDTQINNTQAAQHPADPYRMVVTASRGDGVVLEYSQDGGVNWQVLLSTTNSQGRLFDPLLLNTRYTNASSPSVA